ncbi:MAG: HNH endonuclease [Candidatus Hodarchaeota archaeon]
MNYSEKLKDPRWQEKRKEILKRDNYKCQHCGDTGNQAHHLEYKLNRQPWEYNNEELITLCDACHEMIHRKRISRFTNNDIKNYLENGYILMYNPNKFTERQIGLIEKYIKIVKQGG